MKNEQEKRNDSQKEIFPEDFTGAKGKYNRGLY